MAVTLSYRISCKANSTSKKRYNRFINCLDTIAGAQQGTHTRETSTILFNDTSADFLKTYIISMLHANHLRFTKADTLTLSYARNNILIRQTLTTEMTWIDAPVDAPDEE